MNWLGTRNGELSFISTEKLFCSFADSLDTLAVLGNFSEFRKAARIVLQHANFDKDLNVSVFETNIRGRSKAAFEG